MCFYFRNFQCFSCFSDSHHDLEISFNLNNYFSFTTATLDSVNVKISCYLKQKVFLGICFQNPREPSDIGYPKPNSKIFRIWFTGTKTYFLRPQAKLPRKFDPL
jgi:hypothetical protein